MITITAADLQREFGRYKEVALKEPISVTHHGRESIVLISAEEYNRLKAMEEEMMDKMTDQFIDVHRDTLLKLAK